MKNIITTLTILAVSTAVFAQNNPVDFEADGNGADWSWVVFENTDNPALEIIDNPDATGANTSAKVAKFTARADGATFAGFTTDGIGTFKLDETNRTIKIMVWKSVISDVGIKLEGANGWSEGEIKIANSLTDQWEELTFDFSARNNPPEAGENGEFAKLTIFPDFNERGQENVIYVDYVIFGEGGQGGGGGGGAIEPTVAAPTPTQDAENVISLFSDAYDDVTVDTYLTGWSDASLADVTVDGNAAKKYSNLSFAGIETVANTVDASGMTHFRLDVWSADFTEFKVKLVDFGSTGGYSGDGGDGEGDDTEFELIFSTPALEEWVSYDLPLSDFTGMATANIAQYIISAAPAQASTVFVDNIYFYDANSVNNELTELPNGFTLEQNYPNPFNPTTNIAFNLPVSGDVSLEVFNLQGQKVMTLVNGFKAAGAYTAAFDATNLASGVYVYRLVAGSNIQVKKMLLIK